MTKHVPENLRQRRPVEVRETETGKEQRCNDCGDWLPADTEFFYANNHGRLASSCKVCQLIADRVRKGVVVADDQPPIPDVFSAMHWGAP